jgi:hypothetical protein
VCCAGKTTLASALGFDCVEAGAVALRDEPHDSTKNVEKLNINHAKRPVDCFKIDAIYSERSTERGNFDAKCSEAGQKKLLV